MQAIQFDDDTVFVKSSKGRAEIARREAGLSARERRALILIDGSRDLRTLSQILPAKELEDVLQSLIRMDLIEHSESANESGPAAAAIATVASIAAAAHRPSKETGTIRQVKDFMVVTAHTYLGLLGADVIRRVETAANAQDLLAAAGHWHMALHDSREGKRFAAPYLEQVRRALQQQDEPAFS